MKSSYPSAIRNMLALIDRLETSEIAVDAFLNAIWTIADDVTNPDEPDLRKLLRVAEGNIEMARFTIDAAKFPASLQHILRDLRQQLTQLL